MPVSVCGILLLTGLNIRGVKESVKALVPIFALFIVSHIVLLLAAVGGHIGDVGHVSQEVRSNLARTSAALGTFGALKLFVHAYSMGGGTYTGIEAVSNGVGMMREPRVRTAKRTMVLMATSLAVTAGGIVLSYLLVHAQPEDGKTMNAVLLERVAGHWTIGSWHFGSQFIVASLLSEGALLFVAAQAGFLDGPRVMANMAMDSWLPHRFAALSDRLSMQNGVILMAGAALGALAYTFGDVDRLVVMYSINVFLTFSLSNLGMTRFWLKHRDEHESWMKPLFGHLLALALCATILVITIIEKFAEGGWVTLLVTALLVILCFLVKRHYNLVSEALRKLDHDLPSPVEIEQVQLVGSGVGAVRAHAESFATGGTGALLEHHGSRDPDPRKPVAILLVGGYSGLGRHALLTLLRMFPNHFSGVIFISIAVVDSESFKGADQIAALEQRTRQSLLKYERYAQTLELAAASAFAVGTEVAVELEKIGAELTRRYPGALFVAGQLIFEEDTFWNRLLHNETAFIVQKRLQRLGFPMIVVPVRLDLKAGRPMTVRRRLAAAARTHVGSPFGARARDGGPYHGRATAMGPPHPVAPLQTSTRRAHSGLGSWGEVGGHDERVSAGLREARDRSQCVRYIPIGAPIQPHALIARRVAALCV